MIFVMVIFGLSALGIIGLFALKRWEEATGAVHVPALRARLDIHAIQFKELLEALKLDLEKLPPELVHLSRVGLHELALGIARFARFLESGAHNVADLVSHKGRFQRRAPRSEFLNKVMEHKNGNGNGGDETTNV